MGSGNSKVKTQSLVKKQTVQIDIDYQFDQQPTLITVRTADGVVHNAVFNSFRADEFGISDTQAYYSKIKIEATNISYIPNISFHVAYIGEAEYLTSYKDKILLDTYLVIYFDNLIYRFIKKYIDCTYLNNCSLDKYNQQEGIVINNQLINNRPVTPYNVEGQ